MKTIFSHFVKTMKRFILISITGALVFSGLFFYWQEPEPAPPPKINSQNSQPEIQVASDADSLAANALKPSVLLSVPFVSQAPFGLWAPPYNEACEETDLIMAMRWARGQTLTLDEAAREIVALAVFENKIFGFNEDTNIEQTARLLRDYYNYSNYEVKKNASIGDIKKELNAGNIVIVPVAGKLLNNPHFTLPGPDYHMILIRGYDDNTRTFIANDPGTKFGDGYAYGYLIVDRAWHDWTGSKQTVLQGGRNMLVVRPQGNP